MSTDTLSPANVHESQGIRALLKKHQVRWKALYHDGDSWLIRISSHSSPADLESLRSCPDWEFLEAAAFGANLLVRVRVNS
jgi:hypothetical protein